MIKLPDKYEINPTGYPFSPVLSIRGKEIIVTSGTCCDDYDGTIPEDIETQSRNTLLACERFLKDAGAELSDVFNVEVYMNDLKDWDAFNKIYKEIMESKIVKDINFKGDINVIARTDLPSDEDHNYKYYLENFKRIVNKHNDKIENYKRNHPKFKSIFFAFDESSGYINTKRKQNTRMVGQEVKAKIHFWFMDKEFLNIIKELKIDYFIWYAPYKYYIGINPKILPKVCIYNLKEINKINLIEYDMDTMISSEI